MAETDLQLLKQSIQSHLRENQGEFSYWGEAIVIETKSMPILSKAAFVAGTDKKALLEKLRAETIGDCKLCPLATTRNKLVFGVGNPESKVMFVGEGPGFDEDRLGDPFVGKAGQLLDKIMASIGLDRNKVYIANVVKCHPMVDPTQPEKRGNDRPPQPEEMEKCLPFLLEQIRIVQPKIIITLGATATKGLLDTREGITRLRGQLRTADLLNDGNSMQILPTYHPAALLRNPDLKKEVWEDMKLLRDLLPTL